jgi:ATP-dependent RNA helicase RhlE
MPFTKLGLIPELVRATSASDYVRPTLIQSRTVPVILGGNDLIGTAQTGTGKTAAFVLPILQRLRTPTGKIRALILTPTRELAVQVELAVRRYGRFLKLRSSAIYGGVSQEPQEQTLRRGVDIVVATPGRLLDLIRQRLLDLSSIEVFVLDEADRMLDMGFLPDIRQVVRQLPKERQTLLFSATLPPEIQDLARSVQKDSSVLVEAGVTRVPATGVDQHLYPVPPHLKIDLLLHLLEREMMESLLVFTRTKHGADRLHRMLERKHFKVARIHSGRSQKQRQEALDGFRKCQFQILIATDIAARGIDVQNISHVINYDIPNNADDYIHRVGRTGRAEKNGIAYTFVPPEDEIHVRSIERSIGKRLNRVRLEDFAYGALPKPKSPPSGLGEFNSSRGNSRKEKRVSRHSRQNEQFSYNKEASKITPSKEEQRELKRLQVKLFGVSGPQRRGRHSPPRSGTSTNTELTTRLAYSRHNYRSDNVLERLAGTPLRSGLGLQKQKPTSKVWNGEDES